MTGRGAASEGAQARAVQALRPLQLHLLLGSVSNYSSNYGSNYGSNSHSGFGSGSDSGPFPLRSLRRHHAQGRRLRALKP